MTHQPVMSDGTSVTHHDAKPQVMTHMTGFSDLTPMTHDRFGPIGGSYVRAQLPLNPSVENPSSELQDQTSEQSAWDRLERHLINLGRLSPEGIGRRAQPRRCPTCSNRILTGLDADWAACRADVDPTPLTALGEALAHLEGRRTYALVVDGARHVLDYRDAGRITHRPAGSPAARRLDVLPEHRCGSISNLPTTTSFIVRNHPPLAGGAKCPF